MSSTFKVAVKVPQVIPDLGGVSASREEFFQWLWSSFGDRGLLGVHEGTLLCDQAVEAGLEMDSWLVDSGEAPRERDWIGSQQEVEMTLFFQSREEAERAVQKLRAISRVEIALNAVEEQPPQDWDAEWKAFFLSHGLNNGKGIELSPFWKIIPPWVDFTVEDPTRVVLKVNPGAGFGTGTHETTQLCLELIGQYSLENSLKGQRALDFGSGSGILSVALAKLGARVIGVEIDPLAIANAEENSRLNLNSEEESSLTFLSVSPAISEPFQLIVANILKPVLLEFAQELVIRLAPGGVLILSGLISSDVVAVVERYQAILDVREVKVVAKNEWNALVFYNK